jgi:hypothetical protein
MNRTAKKDVKLPQGYVEISNLILQENDCFGRFFDEFSPICTGYGIVGEGCHARGICELCTHHITTQKSIQAIKKAKGTMLDEIDFSKINESKIVQYLKQNNAQVTITDLTNKIAENLNATDKKAIVRLFIVGLLEINDFIVTNGLIIYNGK